MTEQKLGYFKQLMKRMFLKALKYILFFIPIKNDQLFVILDSIMWDEPCGILRMDLCASQLSYFRYIPLGSMRHD